MTGSKQPPSMIDRRHFCNLAVGGVAAASLARPSLVRAGQMLSSASDIVMMDGLELSEHIHSRRVSCREVMTAYLDHIERINPRVNAIVSLQDRDGLLKQAEVRDAQLKRGESLGWMHGFPQAIKDLAPTKGIRTTWGSPIFADHVPDEDALFVSRMKAAGGIVIGKTNAPEFGLGSQTYNEVFGTTFNAYDQSRTAGGSSGGAAVALALRMLPVADGSDHAGSLRNPAAFNNVLGLRPAYGRVPYPGGDAFKAHLAVMGPMARNARDLAMLLATQCGPDPREPLSILQDPAIFTEPLKRDFKGTRIGWLGDFDGYLPMEPGVMELCQSSFKAFSDIGCEVEPASPDYPIEKVWQNWLTLRHWSVVNWLGPFYKDPAKRKLLKPEAQWEVEGGLGLSAADLTAASMERSNWYRAVAKLFERYDYLLLPTAQVFPFEAETHWPKQINGRRMDTYHRWMGVVIPVTMSGCPAASVPVGFNDAGLPMGVQIVGPNRAEKAVLQLVHAYEQATGWVNRRLPPVLKT
jgi:amidase